MEDLMTFSNNKSWPRSFVVTKIQKQMPMKKRFVVSWYRNKKKIHLKESVSSCYLCVKCSSSFWVKLATSTPCFTVVLFLCFQCGFLDKNTATCLWQELHDRLLQQQWIFCVFSSETLRLSGLLRLSDSWMWRGHEWFFCFCFVFACLFCFERTFTRLLLYWHWVECFPVSVYFQIGYMNWEASPAQGWVYMGDISILGLQFI